MEFFVRKFKPFIEFILNFNDKKYISNDLNKKNWRNNLYFQSIFQRNIPNREFHLHLSL